MKQKLMVVSFRNDRTHCGYTRRSTLAASREFFYVGGKYSWSGKRGYGGQMYVEVLRPQQVTRKYPLVFIHGASQTATNWMGHARWRAGWADYFLGQGYVVCLVDQPARGRSAWHPKVNGAVGILTASEIERRFTAPEKIRHLAFKPKSIPNGPAKAIRKAGEAIRFSMHSWRLKWKA